MGAISRWLDRFCYKHPRLGIPGLMKYIVIANVAVYLMDMFSNGYFSAMLRFYPALIMEGQVWRLLTFIFVPTSGGFILWFALTTLFYYYIGNALENQWGSTRFTVFYGVGVLLNIFTGMVTYWISGAFLETASMYYVNMSMFFAFATLYPDMRVLLYRILPLKVKWLAWVDAALFAFDIGHYFMNGNWVQGMVPIVAILNYFIFFWDDLMAILRRGSSGLLTGRSSDHQLQKGSEGSPEPKGLSPQMRRVRHHRRGRPQHGVPLLFQMQRLLLLLHEAYQRPCAHPMRAGAPGPTARGRLFARELGRSLRWEKAVKNPVDKFCRMQYNISQLCSRPRCGARPH